ncbi:protoheme ix farnesyltransferase [Diplodia corticola]|uniref:Protoheme IX farnesyltransferase, mitochondrial n=1 Tax=Diplodia corticola TaxID=236234 RepID=A0A1J9QZ78_9PEZI|nr:protoheme ix farnesyltransferase [Diplodia corticola]OJD33704.1 protoheme ix farnesyltransferase [Diplodia corticola]
MILRPPLLRNAPPLHNAAPLCLRCLRRLERSKLPPARRLLSTSRAVNDAAIAARNPRTPFKKEYFWANAVLDDVLQGARRGVWSTAVPGRNADNNKDDAAAAAPSTLHDQPKITHVVGTHATAGTELANELPHRRRKRLREEAKQQAASETEIRPDASAALSTSAQALPAQSLRRRFFTYLALTKPRLSFLIVLTATVPYAIYPVPALLAPAATSTPSLSTLTLLFLTTGTALSSASANTFNMLFEPAHDAKMSRTKNRPLVRGLVSKRAALVFALATGAAGLASLHYGVNPTVAFLGGLNIALYAAVYTPLKRLSVVNTWVGAVVGGIPPLMGWTAAAGQCATGAGAWHELLLGPGSAGGWLLGALLFAWQFPHFNALSWTIREEYRNAGYRMLAWTNARMNGRVALRYSLLMFPVCVGLAAVGVTDWGFVATSSAINGWMTYAAARFWWYEGARGTARALFWASVWHLPIVLVLAMAHKKGLWQRVWNSVVGEPVVEEDEEEDDEYWDEDEDEQKAVPQPPGKPLVPVAGR